MKNLLLRLSLLTALVLTSSCFRLSAQATSAPAPTTPITLENLDPAAFAEWVDGSERPIPAQPGGKPRLPESILWTTTPHFLWPGFVYGDSKTAGIRHLRFGFKNPVEIGSVLVHGGGQVSVLKPGAAYPGDLNDDSQWIPAQRIKNGLVTTDEVGEKEVALWVLPVVTATRALRFTHVSQLADKVYGGNLGGAYVVSERLANLSPQAVATARTMPQHADRLNNERDNEWVGWENMSSREGDRPKLVADDPEWVMLTWPTPVKIKKLAFIASGFADADVQIYTGPVDKHPRTATEAEWKTVKTVSGIKSLYPSQMPVDWLDLDEAVTTRALRLRMTAALNEQGFNGNLIGATVKGKRVWLGQLMALQALDASDLKVALLPVVKPQGHAPIPIKFSLPEDALVTLVIEDSSGKRVRNLIADTPFPKGENTTYWDGTDDLGRDIDAASHGLYNIPAELVAPGTYSVRGLWHRKIDLNYELSVYSPGDPPWPTQDTSGGWMTNHTPASCVAYIPAEKAPGGKPLMAIGAYVSEGGSAFSWTDLDGKKIGGRGWIGGVWTGAQFLAVDTGPNAEPNVATYVGSIFQGDKKYGVDGKVEVRLTKLTTLVPGGDQPVLKDKLFLDMIPTAPNESKIGGTGFPKTLEYLGGLAVRNGILAFSETAYNKIVFIDAKAGTILSEAPLTHPGVMAYDKQGRLLVFSGQDLLRYPAGAETASPKLPDPEKLITGREDPRGMTVGPDGKIYISDRGTSHQVKVFSEDGKPVTTYGVPGVPRGGPYDPNHMNNPKGLAVDSNGRLWVTEEDYQPKRVSVWNPDGTLWKAFYGPAQYGGGGALDTQDGSRFSYNGMEFHVDWDKGDATLKRVYLRNDDGLLKKAFRFSPPERALHFNGQRYMTNAFNSNPTNGAGLVFLFLDKGDVVRPVAAIGNANDWEIFKGDDFKSLWPPGIDLNGDRSKNQAMFLWSDLNGDGQVQPDEVKMFAQANGGITVANDGSFVVNNVRVDKQPGHVMRYKPVSFTKEGVPAYDPRGEILSDSNGPASSGGDQALLGTDGWTVLTNAPPPFSARGLGGTKNGVAMWSYPSLWPGLHASHEAPPPDHPGELIGTTRLLGDFVTPKDSDSGPLFFINSNMGNMYVMTQDGLFVAQLFQDVRQGQLWEMPVAQRGMLVNDISLHDENFFPTVTQVPDGSIYVDSGALSALVKVNGLESIHRIAPMSLRVSADELNRAQDFVTQREAARQAAQGTGVLAVAMRSQPPAMDANLNDWSEAQWAPIDQRGVAANFNSNSRPYNVQAAVAIAKGQLFALWQTGDKNLLKNSGVLDNAPFKTGGALDLMIGTDPKANPKRLDPVVGDLRLLVTQVNGKTKAELYRAVVPGTAAKDKVPFNAPWHGITFDSVIDVSDKVQLIDDGRGNYEIAVPLNLLGLTPQDGMKINGDIGVLRGDGTQTTQRVYWNNKATAIVSDVPSEAMLTPSLWGIWEFHSQ